MSESVIIYGPKGPERHTPANARDLVYTGLYSWAEFFKTTPTAIAPFARLDVPSGSLSQDVLDKAIVKEEGGASGAASSAAAALAAQQAQMQAALIQQQALAQAAAQAQAAAAAAPAVEIPDFSQPVAVDASDLDDEGEADAEEVVGDEPIATPTPRGRGRPRKNA
ncbi:hypothetical protein HOU00_gp090 [Caulobacter phage CcrPW]|uniref:Uncharacterized protein n=1 Tax=Caulobacter phage CcrPW TaxID=2283271 RepID=A0A385ED49_9CAUD|nr:hypothetical protein HOU00_gp090 [Caulobacter phage CcrPW]AXQ68629.1 hypothetical protein CcrPW_gp090 [Caulobacter phage CcrPW]